MEPVAYHEAAEADPVAQAELAARAAELDPEELGVLNPYGVTPDSAKMEAKMILSRWWDGVLDACQTAWGCIRGKTQH
ncbi:MAG TPA: hypothetical protein VM328_11035 [Fimbriimonadaceae bacterium]|nr:hypothetical protein [Fimbriimonadaceae bacterium]